VTDNAGATTSTTRTVTVVPWNLTVAVSKVKGVNTASLAWNAAATSAAQVNIYRDGALIKTTANTGTATDATSKGKGPFTYKVCPVGDTRCSNEVRATF
jgi:hypothetical protein